MFRRLFTLSAFLATVVGANWAVAEFGTIPVGFGLLAPAGVLFAGLAFTLRDLLDDLAGWRWVAAGVAGGAGLSFVVASPALALASAVAFGVSEVADWVVYRPLRRRKPILALAASNVVGLVVDSVIFLVIAFGSLAFLPGQIVGKAWVTVATVALVLVARSAWRTRGAGG